MAVFDTACVHSSIGAAPLQSRSKSWSCSTTCLLQLSLRVRPQSERCVPSQRGLLPVFLHPQNGIVPDSSALNSTGERPLPLCEPSQNGWLPLLPQAHHQYDLPASTSIRCGLFCAITGCVPDISSSPFSWF